MKALLTVPVVIALVCALPVKVLSQGPTPFDVDAYRQFLSVNRDMGETRFSSLYPAGGYARENRQDVQTARYFSAFDSLYALTAGERTLFSRHGFVVSERLERSSFVAALLEVYQADLPVFVTTDAILHAFHLSYDLILKDVERSVLSAKLDTLLTLLHNHLPVLQKKYSANADLLQALRDVDLYLTVARSLLVKNASPAFMENSRGVEDLLRLIQSERPAGYKLFAEAERMIDFSQFTPRGHYTESEQLKQYFKAMMWLGRTEWYLSKPATVLFGPSEKDVQRQTIGSVLLAEASGQTNADRLVGEMNSILEYFVGESDNVSLVQLQSVVRDFGLGGIPELADSLRWKGFQSAILSRSFAEQRICSQILWSDPMSPERIKPASAFLLLGQRFIVDSYVMSNVVYDRILFQGSPVLRMLPSTLDVLFALGNNGAGQLLLPELTRYPYASNLAALRYLVDGYEQSFWRKSIYHGWLNAIRTLNPPDNRSALPGFMTTAAWWQEKMNTQLAAWSQLRHDNLLYAKQSYTGGVVCSFPESYVEPIPEFYGEMKSLADTAERRFSSDFLKGVPWLSDRVKRYFGGFRSVMDSLQTIARKELQKVPLSQDERDFLKRMLYKEMVVCAPVLNGWYTRLHYGEIDLLKPDLVVADIHTAPSDAAGTMVGWVLHAGTGPVNMALFAVETENGTIGTFAGPVLSYYEHLSTNFKRLTDEEWQKLYAMTPTYRPSLVNLYLADRSGNSRGDGLSLLTDIDLRGEEAVVPREIALQQNYPNPFNAGTILRLTVPYGRGGSFVDLRVTDVRGQVVRSLLQQQVPEGELLVRWDGMRDGGTSVASGVYFFQLRTEGKLQVQKCILLR